MKGRLYKTEIGKWFVNHESKIIPLHPEINLIPTPFNNYGDGCEVNFIIVDEFTHPNLFERTSWGDGPACAWLTTENLKEDNQIDILKSIKELGKNTPNDMEFGSKVRKLINKI
jgi:hypothetical protein